MTAGESGRTGPYPADQRRFDPLKFDPPGEWSLERHTVGGNVDFGSSYERATWKHPYYGRLTVTDTSATLAAFEIKTPYGAFHGDVPLEDPTFEEREAAYDAAAEVMVEHAEAPVPLDRLAEGYATILSAANLGGLTWADAEDAAAALCAEAASLGLTATAIHDAVRAGGWRGRQRTAEQLPDDEWFGHLPTHQPLAKAGLVLENFGPAHRELAEQAASV